MARRRKQNRGRLSYANKSNPVDGEKLLGGGRWCRFSMQEKWRSLWVFADNIQAATRQPNGPWVGAQVKY
jgi:hypothetical protein